MTYSVTSMDASAEGMERLRNQDEFILLAYVGKDSILEEIANDWHQDIESCDRFEGFDYSAAHAAVDEFVKENREALDRSIADIAHELPDEDSDEFDPDMESPCLRLYVEFPDASD